MAEGQIKAAVPGADRLHELGSMASAMEIYRSNAGEKLRLEAQSEAERSLADSERMDREKQKLMDAENRTLQSKPWPRGYNACRTARLVIALIHLSVFVRI
ncbi:hypothetical protein G6L24_24455 [Agrobacterium tumefaciens]|nr:hypothetical protein [Agrobacterium tumefaciens]